MKETDALDEYILQHIDEENDYLKALYRATHVKLLRPRYGFGAFARSYAEDVRADDTSEAGA